MDPHRGCYERSKNNKKSKEEAETKRRELRKAEKAAAVVTGEHRTEVKTGVFLTPEEARELHLSYYFFYGSAQMSLCRSKSWKKVLSHLRKPAMIREIRSSWYLLSRKLKCMRRRGKAKSEEAGLRVVRQSITWGSHFLHIFNTDCTKTLYKIPDVKKNNLWEIIWRT